MKNKATLRYCERKREREIKRMKEKKRGETGRGGRQN